MPARITNPFPDPATLSWHIGRRDLDEPRRLTRHRFRDVPTSSPIRFTMECMKSLSGRDLLSASGWVKFNSDGEVDDESVTKEDISVAMKDSEERLRLLHDAWITFDRGCRMPDRLQRSRYSLQATPSRLEKGGIILRPEQLEGTGLLCRLEREVGLVILADDMGVGKTFELIALMLAHPLPDDTKTTLLVVPLVAMDMWKENLMMVKEPLLNVLTDLGPKKAQYDVTALQAYDVVLTTYDVVEHQYRDMKTCRQDIHLATRSYRSRVAKKDGQKYFEPLKTHRPYISLYALTWGRVILDGRQSGGGRVGEYGRFNID